LTAAIVHRRLNRLCAQRLCRLPCGKALPYRNHSHKGLEASPRRHSLERFRGLPVRRSLTARKAAKPLARTVGSRKSFVPSVSLWWNEAWLTTEAQRTQRTHREKQNDLKRVHSLSTYLIIIILHSVVPISSDSPRRASTSYNEFYPLDCQV
jgi:hypothetical protein